MALLPNGRFPLATPNGHVLKLPIATWLDSATNEPDIALSWPGVLRIIIIQHGVDSSGLDPADRSPADLYRDRMAEAIDIASPGTLRTLIIAPQLVDYDELPNETRLRREWDLLYWKDGRFWGRDSADLQVARADVISSIDVYDQLLRHLVFAERFPDLRQIVVAGHSGGGQLVNRLAALSRFTPPDGVNIRYVIMNPGSWLYFSKKRYDFGDPANGFRIPDDAALERLLPQTNHPDLPLAAVRKNYDKYGYGLSTRTEERGYGYVGATTDTEARDHYHQRVVVHLIGTSDTNVKPLSIGALTQGEHRYQRAVTYREHLADEGVWNPVLHAYAEVPDVGHDGEAMILSEQGMRYLLDYEDDGPKPPPQVDFVSVGRRLIRPVVRFLEGLRGRTPDRHRGG